MTNLIPPQYAGWAGGLVIIPSCYLGAQAVFWLARSVGRIARGTCSGIAQEFRKPSPLTVDKAQEQAARLMILAEELKAQEATKKTRDEADKQLKEYKNNIKALDSKAPLPPALQDKVQKRVKEGPPLALEFPQEPSKKKVKDKTLIKIFQKTIDQSALRNGMVQDTWDSDAKSKMISKIRTQLKARKIRSRDIDRVIEKLKFHI